MFSVDQIVSLSGENLMNEDAVGWTVGAAWVIDGATPLGSPYTLNGLSSAAWYAARLSSTFSRLSADPDGVRAVEVVSRAQIELADEMRNRGIGDAQYPPSASAVYLAVADGSIEIAVVGDVEALIVNRSGSTEVVSNDLPRTIVHTSAGEIRWGDISDLHRQRQAILDDRGYSHVLSLAPLHSAATLERVFAASQVQYILMFSDGFGRLRDLGHKSMLNAVARGEVTLCEAALALRRLEGQVSTTSPKTSDDATALLLSFPNRDRSN